MDNCKWQSANFKSTGNYTSSQVTYYIINHQHITEGLSRAHLTFTTSRASEIKARAKEALSINLHSEKYIRILQMFETQLKRNRKGNSPFYHSPLCLSSMTPPCSHDSHYLPVLYTSQTWPCNLAPPPYFTPAHCSLNPEPVSFYSEYSLETHDSVSEHQLLWTSSGTTIIISHGLIISG